MSHRANLLIVAGLALLALGLELLGLDGGVPRMLLGLVLVLVLPGYALSAAAFPALGRIDRALFAVGFSLGTAILSGFVLHWVPWGLQRTSWTALLAVITLGACLAALRRQRPPVAPRLRSPLGISLGQALQLGLAGLAIGGSMLVARSEAAHHPAPDVVQLWILPGEVSATVRVGVITHGPVDERYRLVLQRDGQTIREWPALHVPRDTRWESSVELPPRQAARGPLEARLYRASAPSEIFRQVTLWPAPSASATAR